MSSMRCSARAKILATRSATARSAAHAAAWKLAKTTPTTLAGASTMLAYITSAPAVGLFDLGESDWHEDAFRSVIAGLAKLARAA
jgi:hypothetical protein